MNSENLKAAVIVSLHRVGHVPNLFDDSADDTLIIGIQIGDSVRYIRDTLPPFAGSAVHRLTEAVTSYSINPAEADVDALLGQAVLAEVVPSESFAALRQCRPFPSPPRFSAPGFRFVSRDTQLTGQRNGVAAVVGGSRPIAPATFPAPPAPRTKLTAWNVTDLREAKLPQGLPAICAQYAMRSIEWKELEADAAPAPSKRK